MVETEINQLRTTPGSNKPPPPQKKNSKRSANDLWSPMERSRSSCSSYIRSSSSRCKRSACTSTTLQFQGCRQGSNDRRKSCISTKKTSFMLLRLALSILVPAMCTRRIRCHLHQGKSNFPQVWDPGRQLVFIGQNWRRWRSKLRLTIHLYGFVKLESIDFFRSVLSFSKSSEWISHHKALWLKE